MNTSNFFKVTHSSRMTLKKAGYLKGVEDLHNKQGSQLKRIYPHDLRECIYHHEPPDLFKITRSGWIILKKLACSK